MLVKILNFIFKNNPHSDTFSMIESIELRNPYLNTSFVEMMLNIDLELIYNNWNKTQKLENIF